MKRKTKKYDGLYLRGTTWWMQFSCDGQHFRRSTGTTDEQVAKKILKDLKAKIALDLWHPEQLAPKHLFGDMAERFFEEHVPTVSESMQKSYRNSLAHLEPFFSGMVLDRIEADQIMQYQAPRRKEGNSTPATRNRERAMLSTMLNKARRWGWVKVNNCELVDSEPENNEDFGQHLTTKQEQDLLKGCQPYCNGQLAEMVELAIHTGIREENVISLRWDKIDFDERTFDIIQKGNRLKVVAMNDTVYRLLLDKSKVRSISGYVFVTENGTPYLARNMYREFKKVCRSIGIPSFRFHDLRHTCGTRLAQKGKDGYGIQAVLGHSQISTTLRYAKHNVQSQREMLKELDKKPAVNE